MISARFRIFFANNISTSSAIMNFIPTRLNAKARKPCTRERRQQNTPKPSSCPELALHPGDCDIITFWALYFGWVV